jgi:DNA-directed RNA polymerase specialized sigma24 family protein
MDDATSLTTDELADRCREESDRPGQESTGGFSSCWELFRRAMVEDDQQAWQALLAQYQRLVGKWAAGSELKLEDAATEAFARFWQGTRGQDFAGRFPTLGQVMSFLKHCARCLAIDEHRRREHQERIREALAAEPRKTGDSAEHVFLKRISSQGQRAYLYSKLRDEDERLIFRLVYDLGLKPREIVEQYPHRFPTARDVYRIRERIVRRLSEDPMVQQWNPID